MSDASDERTPSPLQNDRIAEPPDSPDPGASVSLPAWMRWVLAAFGLAFGGLAAWLTTLARSAEPVSVMEAVLTGILALLLLVAAARRRVWKWLWLILPG